MIEIKLLQQCKGGRIPKASIGIDPRPKGDTLPIAAHGRKRERGPETRERASERESSVEAFAGRSQARGRPTSERARCSGDGTRAAAAADDGCMGGAGRPGFADVTIASVSVCHITGRGRESTGWLRARVQLLLC